MIINKNIKLTTNIKFNLIIYNQNKKTSNLVIKNNDNNSVNPLDAPNVIYKLTCAWCNNTYVGVTRVSLRKSLT